MADNTGKSTSIWYIKTSTSTSHQLVQSTQEMEEEEGKHENIRPGGVGGLTTTGNENQQPATMNPKLCQLVDLSYARDLITLTEIMDTTGTSIEMELLQIIFHESLEATSMELRVLPLHNNYNYSGTLYIGMSNGIIQKHTIREFY